MEYASEEAINAIRSYPASEAGCQRWIIWLQARQDRSEESGLLLQVRVGLSVETDGVNRYGLIGQLVHQTVPGWGYSFYRYEGQPVVTSTRVGNMGFGAEDSVIWNSPTSIPYNSRLPIVIYTPEKMQVSHRIFEIVSDYQSAQPG